VPKLGAMTRQVIVPIAFLLKSRYTIVDGDYEVHA
jgi:hypothetical protein